jgi:hypothetical protein
MEIKRDKNNMVTQLSLEIKVFPKESIMPGIELMVLLEATRLM